jgi:hypothetical protein
MFYRIQAFVRDRIYYLVYVLTLIGQSINCRDFGLFISPCFVVYLRHLLRCTGYVAWKGVRTMNYKFGRIWMKANLICYNALYHFTDGTEEKHRKSVTPALGSKIKPGTFIIKFKSSKH